MCTRSELFQCRPVCTASAGVSNANSCARHLVESLSVHNVHCIGRCWSVTIEQRSLRLQLSRFNISRQLNKRVYTHTSLNQSPLMKYSVKCD